MTGQPTRVSPFAHHGHCSRAAYIVSVYARTFAKRHLQLLDRGASGSIVSDDTRHRGHTGGSVDLTGFDSHTVQNLPLSQSGATVNTNRGPVIGILNQVA